MTTEVDKLLIRLEANLTQFEKQFAKANNLTQRELRSIEKQAQASATRIEAAMGRVGGAFKSFGAGAIAGLGVESLARTAQSAIKSIADIGDQAQKVGLATDEFQRLSFVAQLSGMEVESLARFMKNLGVNSSDAARGEGEFAKLLAANNISLRNANGEMRSQTEILAIVADLVRNAASEQDALRIATTVGGKAGSDAMVLLKEGAEGVRDATREAAGTPLFTDEQIRAAQEYDDKLDTLTTIIGVELKGAILDAVDTGVVAFGQLSGAVDRVVGTARGLAELLQTIASLMPGANMSKDNPWFSLSYNGKTLVGNAAPGETRVSGGGTGGPNEYAQPPLAVPVRATTEMPPGDTGGTSSRNNRAQRLREQAERERKRLAEEAAREAEAKRRAIEGVIDALKFEGEQLQSTALQQQINNELRRAGVSATSAQGKEIAALATKNYELEASERFAVAASEVNMERMQELRDGMMDMAAMAVDAFDSIVIGGENAGDVLKGLVKQMASMALQSALLGRGPMANLMGTSAGGGLFGALFGGFRASGGNVNAGSAYVVGEQGRELFVPDRPGRIVPNGRMGGAPSVVFAPVINAQGADPAALARVESTLYRMQRDLQKTVVNTFNRERGLNAGFSA